MTCILGYQDPETSCVYIAADGMTCCGDEIATLAKNKIVRCGPYTVGIAGQTRVQNLVENDPDFREVKSVWELAQLLYRKLPEIGITPEEEKRVVKCWGFGMVVAGPDNDDSLGLFALGQGCEFSQIEPGRPVAMGSGGEAAEGALWLLLDLDLVTPAAIKLAMRDEYLPIVLRKAVGAAAKVMTTVGGAIHVVALQPEGSPPVDPRRFGIDDQGNLAGTTLPVVDPSLFWRR